MTARRLQQGFTLLELLTVILIISSLITIVVPKFVDSIRKSAVQQCSITRLFTQQAAERYASDHEDKEPAIGLLAKENYLETEPRCSAGGVYAWLTLDSGVRIVACSLHGWTQDDAAAAPAPSPDPGAGAGGGKGGKPAIPPGLEKKDDDAPPGKSKGSGK